MELCTCQSFPVPPDSADIQGSQEALSLAPDIPSHLQGWGLHETLRCSTDPHLAFEEGAVIYLLILRQGLAMLPNPPASAFYVVGTTGMGHSAQLAWESYLGVTWTSKMHANLAIT